MEAMEAMEAMERQAVTRTREAEPPGFSISPFPSSEGSLPRARHEVRAQHDVLPDEIIAGRVIEMLTSQRKLTEGRILLVEPGKGCLAHVLRKQGFRGELVTLTRPATHPLTQS